MNQPIEDLDRARSGDRAALDRLLARNRARLDRAARAQMHAPLRARIRTSDIVQSAYVEVLCSLPAFRGTSEEAFAEWVVRIVENTVRDKRRYFHAAKRDSGTPVVDRHREGDEIPDNAPSPSAEVALGDELLLFGRALQRLPDDYRRVLLMRLAARKHPRDAAEAMNRSPGATRVLLARARAALLVQMRRLRPEIDVGR